MIFLLNPAMFTSMFTIGMELNPNTVFDKAQIMAFCRIFVLYKYFFSKNKNHVN